jgi:RNA polymerase sigma-54 factor
MQGITQTIIQGTRLSPNQIQFIRMLSLPLLTIEQRIKEELELNPTLEEGMDLEDEQAEEQEKKEDMEFELIQQKEDNDENEREKESETEYEWDEFLSDDTGGYKTGESHDPDEDKREFVQPAVKSLSEHLIEQINLLNLSDEEIILSEEIIGNLEDDGYLRRALNTIVDDTNLSFNLNISYESSEILLKSIQHLDPVGIGSRNLQECLLVQLEVMENNTASKEIAYKLLNEYYDDFSKKHYDDISRKMNIPLNEIKAALEVIQKLNPKPGEGQFSTVENYIIPDFFVHYIDNDLLIQMNEKNIPPLRISRYYKQMYLSRKRKKLDSETKTFLNNKIKSAEWFINCIIQRQATLKKVIESIVDKQREFFINGEEFLKPMIYKDIATDISMDIATISRAVRGKYVETDYGTFELKYFFSEKLEKSDGENISNKTVKQKIKDLVSTEPKDKPLTDDKIVELLKLDSVLLSRRTVTKYREQMSIPPARLRKEIL